MGNNSPAPRRAHGHSYFITRSTYVTAIRASATILQLLVARTKRAHRSRPPRLLQEEHGCLEHGACSLLADPHTRPFLYRRALLSRRNLQEPRLPPNQNGTASSFRLTARKEINKSHAHDSRTHASRTNHTHTTRTTPQTPKRAPPTNTQQRSKVARKQRSR